MATKKEWPDFKTPDAELNDLTSMLAEARVAQKKITSTTDKAVNARSALGWASEYLHEPNQALRFGDEGMVFQSYPRQDGHGEFLSYLERAIKEALPELLGHAKRMIESDLWAARCLVEQSRVAPEKERQARFKSLDYVAREDILEYAREHDLDAEMIHNRVVDVLLEEARLISDNPTTVSNECHFTGYAGGKPHWSCVVLYGGNNSPGVSWHWGGTGRRLSVEEVLAGEVAKAPLDIRVGDYVTGEAIAEYAASLQGALSEEEVHNEVLGKLRDRCRELGTCLNHGGEFGDNLNDHYKWDAIALNDEGQGSYEVSWIFKFGAKGREIDIDKLLGSI